MSSAPRSLLAELQQSQPFRSIAEETLVSVLRTAAVLRRAIAQRVEPYGISPAQYNVLRILRGAGEKGLPTLEVRERLIEEAPGITRLIDKLEQAGHVRRDRSGKDRRKVHCCITPSGRALLEAMDTLIEETTALISAGLPEEAQQRRMIEMLALVREGVGG